MPTPTPNSLAIIGAGPVGLEAALAAVESGLDVHVFERGEAGAHVRAWGHVPMFTPWRMNWTERGTRALAAQGWTRPDADACPTGHELADHYLDPIARLPQLQGRIHSGAQVVHISRAAMRKGDAVGKPERRTHPFRIMVRERSGRESFLSAFAVIDASGVYGQPNWMGSGGIPARNETYLAPQLSYHLDDILGAQRDRYAGRRTLLVGGGHSAATAAALLARLAQDAPGTTVIWATRRPATALYIVQANDPLAGRTALDADARSLVGGANPAIAHVGGVEVEGLEFNSATHKFRVTLVQGEHARVEEVHNVLALVGFGPDNSLYRELQVHECYASRGPMKLAAALLGADAKDCLDVPAFGADVLASPEPDFYIAGNKSYGRTPSFLLQTGYTQVDDIVRTLVQRLSVPA